MTAQLKTRLRDRSLIPKMQVLLFVLVACFGIQVSEAWTVLQELNANPEYTIFRGWLSEGTKVDLGVHSMTVFIPTNGAARIFLEKHPERANDTNWLRNIAEHYVVVGNLGKDQLLEKGSLRPEGSSPTLWLYMNNGSIYINNAKVTSSTATSNGHVHELDAVIYPLGITGNSTLKDEIGLVEEYSGFKSLVVKATKVGALLDNNTVTFTVFSPNPKAVTDDIKAMNRAQLLSVIQNHVIKGQVLFSAVLIGQSAPLPTLKQGAMINVKVMDNTMFVGSGGYWSMIESVDVSTSNGVIHVINGVLGVTPGVNIYQALGLFDSSKFGETIMTEEFTVLKKDLMSRTKMYTVFLPQDTAWANVSGASDITTLEKILKRHILMEKLTTEELMNTTEVLTMSGEKLAVKNENGSVYLEFDNMKAKVTPTGYMASNGIIHAIDKVLVLSNSPRVNVTLIPETNETSKTSIYVVLGVLMPVGITVVIVIVLIRRRNQSNSKTKAANESSVKMLPSERNGKPNCQDQNR